MKTINMLPSLSFLRPSKWSPTVVPLSESHSFNRRSTSFDNLKLSLEENKSDQTRVSAIDLLDDMVGLVKVQKKIVSAYDLSKCDKNSINEYLEDGVEMLDVCKLLLEKIEFVKRYADSIQRATRLFHPDIKSTNLTRVKELLSKKKYDEDEVSMEKCWSRLKRLIVKEKKRRQGESDTLTNSLTNAFYPCKRLDSALSFKRNTSQMSELKDVITLAKKLRDLTVEEASDVDKQYVKKKCDELVDGVKPLEEKINELYKQLMCIRMSLLGIASY